MSGRITWVDRIKGIMIILVVLGHSCTPALCQLSGFAEVIYLVINSFNMPVFFVLSGMIELNKDEKKKLSLQIVRRAHRLMLPYAIYLTGVYAIFLITSIVPYLSKLLSAATQSSEIYLTSYIADLVFCKGLIDKHLWFLYVLFVVSVVVAIARKVRLNTDILMFLGLIVVILMKTINPKIDESSYHVLYFVFYYLFFYCAGKYGVAAVKWNRCVVLISGVAFAVLEIMLVVCFDFFRNHGLAIFVIKLIIGVVSSAFLISIFSCFSNMKTCILDYIGKNSFSIYLIHQTFLVSGVVFLLLKLELPIAVIIIIASIIGVFIPLILNSIYNQFVRKRGA